MAIEMLSFFFCVGDEPTPADSPGENQWVFTRGSARAFCVGKGVAAVGARGVLSAIIGPSRF